MIAVAGAIVGLGRQRSERASIRAEVGTVVSASASPTSAQVEVRSAERRALDEAARAPATSVRIALAENGGAGAWLVVGPYRSATFREKTKPAGSEALDRAPPDVDEGTIAPSLGAAYGPPVGKANAVPTWKIASSGEGAIDLKSALAANEGDVIGYAAARLHLETKGRFYLLLGVDDGVRVSIDGRTIWTRDEARPERDDDDLVPLDLDAGDHLVVLKLHQREGAWSFQARLVDGDLAPPIGAYLELPGTSANDARALATKMSSVSVDRGLTASGEYAPKLTVRFPEGAPRGVPLHVRAKLTRDEKGDATRWFDVDAGEVGVDAAGVSNLVVTLPSIAAATAAAQIDDREWRYDVNVAGRDVTAHFSARRAAREAVAHAEHALGSIGTPRPPWLRDGSFESVAHLEARLIALVAHGDNDRDAEDAEARELENAARALERNVDPYAGRTGAMRRAYAAREGELAEFGLYVPPASKNAAANARWPLIVALHGMNGKPLAMMRWLFGEDEPSKDQEWEDRHVDPLPRLDAFVVAPDGFGNSMYRDLGEEDVLHVIDWALANLPIDRSRITITGPSMGGIGSAAIAFHHPDLFAAAAPLCGYHSYFVRRDILAHPLRPWEQLLAEERSNVDWAYNGADLPLWIVHGTQDLPEANSGVLIDRYEKLGYALVHDHPNLGHNVWQTTYEDLKGAHWLLRHRRDLHPRRIRFRTMRLRDGDDAWLHVTELTGPDVWGEVDARIASKNAIDVKTSRVAALRFDRDERLVGKGALTVKIDGAALTFDADESILLHRRDDTWIKGSVEHGSPWKQGEIAGPIRDAFRGPLLFVYGAGDPKQTRANEEVARAWARIRWGMNVHYPVMSDTEFFAQDEPLANARSLFLVGNARSNRVVRELEGDLPIRIEGDAVVVGASKIRGSEVGAAFIRPNPKRADRYVVVVEGVDALGTWRSLSLPDLIPDFVVYDHDVASARGQMLLNAGSLRAGGFFGNDWSLPSQWADPLADTKRPGAKTEHDATPYLP